MAARSAVQALTAIARPAFTPRNTPLRARVRSLLARPEASSLAWRAQTAWYQQQRCKSTDVAASALSGEQGGSAKTSEPAAESVPELPVGQPIGRIEPRLSLTFTCTVPDCNTRSTHEFARKSYERGIVLVQCPGCKNRHLIADHLGWFKESTEDGTLKTVEDLVRAKGEQVRRGTAVGRVDAGQEAAAEAGPGPGDIRLIEGDIEYVPDEAEGK